MLVVLALASSANIHLADSEADIALRVGQRNIKSFQEQTQLMIDAWQDACKIDKACTTADQTILAKVYSYYADTVRCRGNVAFNTVAPPTIAHMMTEVFVHEDIFLWPCFSFSPPLPPTRRAVSISWSLSLE